MYEAAINDQVPDIVTPCMNCKYAQAGACNFNYHLNAMEQLQASCGITVQMFVKGGDKCAGNATDSTDCQD